MSDQLENKDTKIIIPEEVGSIEPLERYRYLFSYNPAIDEIIKGVTPALRERILETYREVKIEEDGQQVSVSLRGLKKLGFTVERESGGISISRQDEQREANIFCFTNKIEASEEQRKAKGYKTNKAVYLEDLEDYIDPYYLVDFLEWLSLQYVFLLKITNKKHFSRQKRKEKVIFTCGVERFLYL
ncbi:MAG: hypothetical protein AAB732_00260 [Patescibacteria group bacterium]